MSEIHISIDDVKGIFKALIKESPSSVFETRTLAFLRDMHRKYGTTFTLYCTYQHDGYSLSGVTDKYRDEFISNSDWLKFGFHCYDEADDYSKAETDDFARKYNSFITEIKRVTGQNEELTALRIHGFAGNEDVCRVLWANGVEVLFASDDNRSNYYLTEQQNSNLNNKLQIFDAATGLKFYKSCTRLEKADELGEVIRRYRELQVDYVPVFTHEWLLDDAEIRGKLETICKAETSIK